MTPAQLQTLSTELKLPAYTGLSDTAAADALAVVNRPADGSVRGMLNYLLVNKNQTGTTGDTVPTSMLGRLVLASQGTMLGTTSQTLDTRCSALAMLEIVRNPGISTLPYQTNTLQQLLTDMVTAGVMKNPDKAAIIALSKNLQSKWSELGLPGQPNPSDVADARRLP